MNYSLFLEKMNHFFDSNADDIDSLQEKSNSKNTGRSTENWLPVYKSWAKIHGYNEKLHISQPDILDKILHKFYTEMQKTNDKYEPDFLKVMLGSLDRHLISLKYPSSLIRGVEFIISRKVLDDKVLKLREQCMGKNPK